MSEIQQEKWIKNPRPPELNRKKNKKWRESNREYVAIKREERGYKSYAASEEWYYETLEFQNGRCAICGSEKPRINGGKRFAIDHNHNCCVKIKHVINVAGVYCAEFAIRCLVLLKIQIGSSKPNPTCASILSRTPLATISHRSLTACEYRKTPIAQQFS